jgi:hypothetical protein
MARGLAINGIRREKTVLLPLNSWRKEILLFLTNNAPP